KSRRSAGIFYMPTAKRPEDGKPRRRNPRPHNFRVRLKVARQSHRRLKRPTCHCVDLVHSGADCCRMETMKNQPKSVRQSVSLPLSIATRVRHLADKRKASANRVLVDLIEAGLRSKEAEKEHFFSLTNQLAESSD